MLPINRIVSQNFPFISYIPNSNLVWFNLPQQLVIIPIS